MILNGVDFLGAEIVVRLSVAAANKIKLESGDKNIPTRQGPIKVNYGAITEG